MVYRKLFSDFKYLILKLTDPIKTRPGPCWDLPETCPEPRQDLPETRANSLVKLFV
jgi:hypothetical protein